MGHRAEKGGKLLERGDIMIGGIRGDMVLQNIAGRRSFTHTETRLKKEQSHLIVTLKGETRENWHMLTSVNITDSRIKVRGWVERWLEVFVYEDRKL